MSWWLLLLIYGVILALGVVALVFGILYLVSFLAGWGALAMQYQMDEGMFKGSLLQEAKPWRVWVGMVRYGSMVRLLVYERGIELRGGLPFQKPLFFPWEEISGYGPARMVSVLPFYDFYVGGRRVRFSSKIDAIEQALGPH
jgi:hypothetical protein